MIIMLHLTVTSCDLPESIEDEEGEVEGPLVRVVLQREENCIAEPRPAD